MSASEVEICNLALFKFGDLQVTSIDIPTNKQERLCKVWYPILRDLLTSQHPWNFAMKRADITGSLTTTPAFEWDYAYTLPSDCLRVWEFYGVTSDWVVENGLLLTNEDEEIYIRYITYVTETGKFPMPFVNCLATLLGSELAPKLMGDGGKEMRTQLLKEFKEILLPDALRLNAIEGRSPRTEDDKPIDEQSFSWQTEGR